ncbi:MAG: hypothetical protein ACREBJ_03785 [Nitrosotalea sp.]
MSVSKKGDSKKIVRKKCNECKQRKASARLRIIFDWKIEDSPAYESLCDECAYGKRDL